MKPLSRSIFQRLIPFSFVAMTSIQPVMAAAPFDLQVHSGMGTSSGTLQWSIAADPAGKQGPNVLSELTYRDVEFSVFDFSGEIRFNQGFLQNSTVFIQYKTGQAIGGEAQDSDFNGNNRTQEYSRSHSSTEDSSMDALDIGMGYRFQMTQHTVLQPMAAFTQHHQTMVMTDGEQIVDIYNPNNLGEFRGTLNSSYSTTWTGAWIGLQYGFETHDHRLSVAVKNYWLDYQAEADWNLRSDFAHPKSFEHWTAGTGTGLELNYQYVVSQYFSLWLNWYSQQWSTETGEDRVYFANGTTGSSQLNGVSWDTSGLGMGLLFRI